MQQCNICGTLSSAENLRNIVHTADGLGRKKKKKGTKGLVGWV